MIAEARSRGVGSKEAKTGLATIALLCGGSAENVLRNTGAIAIYRDPADMLANYDRLTDYGSAEQGAESEENGSREAVGKNAETCDT